MAAAMTEREVRKLLAAVDHARAQHRAVMLTVERLSARENAPGDDHLATACADREAAAEIAAAAERDAAEHPGDRKKVAAAEHTRVQLAEAEAAVRRITAKHGAPIGGVEEALDEALDALNETQRALDAAEDAAAAVPSEMRELAPGPVVHAQAGVATGGGVA